MISVSNLTTVAEVDASVTQANELRSEYSFKRDSLLQQLDNHSGEDTDYETRIREMENELVGMRLLHQEMQPGPEADGMLAEITDIEDAQQNLVDRLSSFGKQALQRKEVEAELNTLCIQGLDVYIGALDTARSGLN